MPRLIVIFRNREKEKIRAFLALNLVSLVSELRANSFVTEIVDPLDAPPELIDRQSISTQKSANRGYLTSFPCKGFTV